MIATSIKSQPVKTREEETDKAILDEAKERVESARVGWKDTYYNSEVDEMFIAGNQWDPKDLLKRDSEGKVSITVNQLQQYVSRVTGAQRKNVQEIKVSPVESNSKEQEIKTVGGQDVKISKVYEGVIRNIQSISNAQMHYKKAFRDGLTGIGWLRVLTEYSRQDSFDLDVKIQTIPNRFSVLIDPRAKEADYSDANFAFVFEKISNAEFKKRYPGKITGDLDNNAESDDNWWYSKDNITITEYFRREPVTRTILLLSDGNTVYKDEVKDVLDELEKSDITVIRERSVKTYKVIWSKITANSILEKEREFPTSTIPIIPVLGREVMVKGKKIYQGLITNARDPQRMLNFWQSAATERVALSPKSPYIVSDKSIEGKEKWWAQANTANLPYLPYKAGQERPSREAPPAMPVAELQMSSTQQGLIQTTIGIYDASLGAQGNETSGRAILARQSEADTGTFEFVDNLSNAMRRIGILCVELIPKVYDTERILRITSPDGSGDFVEINKVIEDEETGKHIVINDLALGKYDVTITTGATYATKRIETADTMMQFAQAFPQVAQVASDIIADNLDFPQSEAIAERLKKTIPPHLLSPEEQEELQKDAPPPQPDPNLEMANQLQAMKLEQEKLKTAQQELKTKQEELALMEQQMKTQNEADSGNNKEELEEKIKDTVAQTIAEVTS